MYSDHDLAIELKKQIERALESGRESKPEWIVHHVMTAHVLAREWLHAADKEFYWLAASGYVRSLVTHFLREYKTKIDLGQMSREPGFALVQQAYLIERRGQQRIVPLGQMSLAEGIAKIKELQAMARGAEAHADELMRYFGLSRDDLRAAE
jgi:hypothetical protein